jgi:hypothetical protein
MWNRPSILVLLVGLKKKIKVCWKHDQPVKTALTNKHDLSFAMGFQVIHKKVGRNFQYFMVQQMEIPWNHHDFKSPIIWYHKLIISYVFLWNVHWNNMSLLEVTEIWHAEISWCIMLYSWQPCGWMLGLRGILHIIEGWHPLEGLYILVQVSLRISGESTPCKDGYIML